ncbi:MAG: DNA polymerase III subunit psi [Bacteroidota bacterium]
MTEDQALLPLFINEELYLIKGETTPSATEYTSQEEEEPQELVEEPEEKSIALKYKGENQKSILILVEYESYEFLHADQETLLVKILAAVQLTLADVAVVNMAATDVEQMHTLNWQYVISFGVKNEEIFPAPDKMYDMVLEQDKKMILCDPLHEIGLDNDKKRNLWSCLKSTFLG